MKNSINVKKVSKTFKKFKALDKVSLNFEENKIYGLLGRNGAGKTTLLNIISNRLFKDEGEVLVDGEKAQDNDKALQNIYLMSERTLYDTSSKVKAVLENTKLFYKDFDISYAKKLANLFKLDINKKISNLSTGYKTIFKNIVALSTNAKYILLDEPVLGMDANHRELFYKVLMEKYLDDPFTLVISTHLIEEIANIIEHIVVIDDGKIIRDENVEELLSRGYTISGKTLDVDEFINSYVKPEKLMGYDTLGGLKTAYIPVSYTHLTLPTKRIV
eukprot:TRINITY_DN7724_c0_g1_i5.p1 TRINITY_DN7724_c0_g1~~TRINITY_DN7724_c0_g1_i5.p1  ORF type:complete len:274 (-),score=-17.36 TRINITY_DN7724_c0_g1_i5:51-872(-)